MSFRSAVASSWGLKNYVRWDNKNLWKKSTYRLKRHSFCYLLDPFWNHWWSLPSDWLSAVWFIHDSHYFLLEITFVLNRIISVLNRTIFALYRIISFLYTKLDVKAFLFLLLRDPYNFGTDWIRWFQNGSNKVVIELRVVQFWSEIILVNSNRTGAARSSDFEITRMILNQIAFHSVQLPFFIIRIKPL